MKSTVLAVGIALSSNAIAFAGEKPVKESEVPKPVIDAVKKKYPAAHLVRFSREEDALKLIYEVKVELAHRKIDVDLSPEGRIMAEEEIISKDALPKEVKEGLEASKYAAWVIARVERVVKEEKQDAPSFELLLERDQKRVEVVFDKTGKLIEEAPKTGKRTP